MMDKSCHSSGDSATNSGGGATSADTGGRDHYLKHLNKLSHKISKPNPKKPSHENPLDQNHSFRPPAPPPAAEDLQTQQQPHQPPVYNINKNDFRDVVQKLTGSPAHERFSAPPPIQPPKPHSTRLQRIRPPPLAHVSNRPPPMLAAAPLPHHQMNPSNPVGGGAPGPAPSFNSFGRPLAPLSPLPPLPSVHGAAESPVSAYMRFLQNPSLNLDPNIRQFSGLSPLAPAPAPPQHQFQQFQLPSSPLPFGCSSSPKSQYALLSPSGYPLSPGVPVSSPRRDRS